MKMNTETKPEFEIGDTYHGEDGESYTAGIHHHGVAWLGDDWLQRIEVHGKNEAHACELRDRVFLALTAQPDLLAALKHARDHISMIHEMHRTLPPATIMRMYDAAIDKAEGRA